MSRKNDPFIGKRNQHHIPLPVIHICGGRGVEEIRRWLRGQKVSGKNKNKDYYLEQGKSLWSFLKSVVPSKKKLRENDTSSV